VILSQACALLQSITNSCSSTPTTYLVTHRNEPRDMLRWSTTFRGLFPFSVFPTIRSLEPQQHSNATRPYVLRVLHPHDVLLPKPSAGLISFRYHSWDFALQGVAPVPTREIFSDSLTLMTFDTTSCDAVPYLQGFNRWPSHAHHAKLFTRIAALAFLGS
jgi:hypothetical protein